MDEVLDVLHALWTHNPIEHHEAQLDIVRSQVDLRPVQPDGPPVLLGGFGIPMLERIGRRADGWLGIWGMPAEYIEMLWQTARQAAVSVGRDPDTLRREVRINVAPGQSVDDLIAVFAHLREDGVDGAFLDFTYTSRSVDESLTLAADVMSAAQVRG